MALLRRGRRRRAIARALVVAFALVARDPSGAAPGVMTVADAAPHDVDQVKAAFLFRFPQFVTWPASSLDPKSLSICVLGEASFAATLEQVIGGRTVGESDKENAPRRAVVVQWHSSAEDAESCQIVFVPAEERARAQSIIERFAKKPILTVGESEGFAKAGGIINFRIEENRVRFEVNPDAAKRAGLELSSQLLKLAILVRE